MTCSRTATHIARQLKARTLALAVAACFAPTLIPIALANPVGPTVVNGAATFATNGNTFAITNTPGAIINWQQFNIGQNEITKFIQQSQQSAVLNRVTGQNPSQIFGALQSNGKVLLINPNGTVFGPNAAVDVFGLVVSNLNLGNADFLAGRYTFAGGGNGSILNQGAITTPVGGSVYLIGSNVTNAGIITSPGGQVLLAAGNAVTLADTGTPNMSVTLTAKDSQAVNLGTISAAGGNIDIYGALINQHGMVRADSASVDAQGRVTLKATDTTTVSGTTSATNSQGTGGQVNILGDKVTMTETATIDVSGVGSGGTARIGGDWQGKNPSIQNATTTTIAAGATIKADATGKSNGGTVVVWSNDKTYFDGLIYARGGANGGDGGQVETSGHTLAISGMVNTTATKGKAGSWLLDPAIACITDNISLCPAGGSNTTTAIVEQALGLNAYLSYSATDYFKFATTSTWVLSSTVPSSGNLSITAPYINLAGSFDAVTNNKNIYFNFNASGTSASFPAKSGMIDIAAGGNTLRTPAGLHFNADKTVNLASDVDFRSSYVTISANDYFVYQPSTSTVSISNGNGISVYSPYIAVGGATTLGSTQDSYGYLSFSATGTSASYPAKSGVVELLSGMKWALGNTSNYSSSLSFNAATRVDLGANTSISNSSNTNNNGYVYFNAPTVVNSGITLTGVGVGLYTRSSTSFTGSPLNGSNWIQVGPYWGTYGPNSTSTQTTLGNVYLGTETCSSSDWCTSNPGKFFTGTYNYISVGNYGWDGSASIPSGSGNLYVTGPFVGQDKGLSLYSPGSIQIDTPLTTSQWIYMSSGQWYNSAAVGSRDLVINQPITASSISASTYGGTLRLNAALTADYSIDITLRSFCTDGAATCTAPITAGFVNKAGANALTVKGTDGWSIANLNGTAQVDLGGLTASGPLTLTEALAKTTHYNYSGYATDPAYTNGKFYVSGASTPIPTVTTPTVTLTTDSGASATDRITSNPALTVSTAASGITRTYTVDGGTASSTYTAPTTDGSHTVVVTDTNASKQAASSTITFTLDKTVVTPTVSLAKGTTTNGTLVSTDATLTTSTPASDVTRTYKVDGGTASSAYVAPTTNGTHTVVVTDTDAAGNTANSSLSFTLQANTLTAPTIALATDSGVSATDLITNNPALTISPAATGITRTYTVDGSPAASTYVAPTADGSHTVVITDKDSAGNVVSSTLAFTLAKSIAKPTVVLANITGTSVAPGTNAAIPVTTNPVITVSPAGSGITRSYAIDGGTATSISDVPATPGNHTVVVIDTDVAGNTASASVSFLVQATTQVEQAIVASCTTNALLCANNATVTQSGSATDLSPNTVKAQVSYDEKVKALEVKTTETKPASESKPTSDSGTKPVAAADKPAAVATPTAAAQPTGKTVLASAQAADARKSSTELKAEAQQAATEAKQIAVTAKQATTEARQAVAAVKVAAVEAKKAETLVKAADTSARKADAEAKQAEAAVKTAKTPEQKVQAETRKVQAEAKRADAEAKRADAEAKKPEAEAKQATAEAKQVSAEAKQAQSAAKQSEAEAKQAAAAAKEARTPEQKLAAERRADEKRVETIQHKATAEVKQTKTEAKQAEAEVHNVKAEAKKSEAAARHAEAEAKKAELAKTPDRKDLVAARKAEAESKQKAAEAKKVEADTKLAALERRQEARRADMVKAFAKTAMGSMAYEKLAEIAAIRHEMKTEMLKPALTILEQNPNAADLPPCGAGSDVCVPAVAEAAAKHAGQAVPAVALPKPTMAFVPQIERKVAVLVGINKYADKNIPSLESAVPDVEAVAKLMQDKLGYEVRIVRDGTKADIVKAIKAVGNDVGPNDSVTVYYAGHGYMLEHGDKNVGYWIPSDATVTTPKQWLSSNDIAKLLGNIPAKQIMLVSDSCYSGSLTGDTKVSPARASGNVQNILSMRSVTVMSSGGEEPVSDEGKDGHSIFAWSLMNSIDKVDQYESGAHLFGNVKDGVMNTFPQVPQYGAATSAGHTAGGDYLLEVRSYK